jgi:acid phosphatase
MTFLCSLVKVIYPLLVILAAVLLYNYGPEHSLTTLISPVTHHTPTSPYAASWRSWFHPLQSQLGYAPISLNHDWNVLHHLGGNGPWVEMLDEGRLTPDLAPPPGCSIDQVHMVRNLNDNNGEGKSLLISYRCRGTQRDIPPRLLAIVSFIGPRQADLSSR